METARAHPIRDVIPDPTEVAELQGKLGLIAFTASGDAIMASNDPGNTGDGDITVQERLYLREGLDGDTTVLPLGPARSAPAQIISASGNDKYVVWQETRSTTIMDAPWAMYAYDRDTRTTQEVAKAPRTAGGNVRPVPGYTGPRLLENRLIWSQSAVQGRQESLAIWGCELPRCTPRMVIQDAAFPALTPEGVYAVGAVVKRGVANPTGELVAANGAAPCQPPPGGNVLSFTAVSRACVLITRKQGDISLSIARPGSPVVTIHAARGEVFGYPMATERFVAWAQTGEGEVGGYLYDLTENQLYALGNARGLYAVEGAKNIVSWQEQTARGVTTYAGSLPS